MSSEKSLIVKYHNEFYDITDFAHKHPGGIGTLGKLTGTSDITHLFTTMPPHSAAAKYLMKEYRVDNAPKIKENGKSNGIHLNGNNYQHYGKETNNNGDLHTALDDSMEHLVDWSCAMIPQIKKLGSNYVEWVNKPVDRPLRLFGPWYLEILTKTPWYVVPIFWIPIIIYLVISGSTNVATLTNELQLIPIAACFGLGVTMWTLIEYSLHRWVFHMDAKEMHWTFATFHFLIHGLHHKVPFDPYRLVFPPVPAMIIASILYPLLLSIFQAYSPVALAGGLTGYVVYDMIHFYLHYGSPSGGHMYFMKRYHYQHHFVHHDKGFGISSSVWDDIFGTKILLRSLQYILRWR
uniref:Fatty acid 2-hydroxylase n=1 Tax=Nyssomyia neivai TaxID=330878 RepID=A0A1L8DYG7_9DIPT